MKLISTSVRLPADMHIDAERWVCNYNSLHVTRSDFYKINISDVIRTALKYFLDHHSAQKTFFPKS